jgi:tol-pal system protein YbgF
MRWRGVAAFAVTAGATLATLPGCYAPQMSLLRSGLDSLRVQVDTLQARNAVAYEMLTETRSELAAQHDLLLSTRATTGTSSQEMIDQMSKFEDRLNDVMSRINQSQQRATTPPAGSGQVDPNQLYDQAAQDLTQGRYGLALQEFRDFVRRFPSVDLSDNAQYGVGECFFAQTQFDSAAVAYADVEARWKDGDKVPAALYKLALSQDRLGKKDAAKKTFEDLVKRFPNSGEAQLARERLGTTKKR